MSIYDISLYIYNLSLIPVMFFTLLFLFLSLLNLFMKKENFSYGELNKKPFVSIQIPTYNDPIAERCIKCCMEMDYEKDNYEIIIADDSTNPKTMLLLKNLADKNQGFVKYIHRNNRQGFKAGALKNAMKITKGEIIVIFDSDWIPKKSFLNEIIKPFADANVAIVQTRQGFYNKNTTLLTRFSSYVMLIYHTIVMPINNKINCVFFCGTAGAIRKKMYEDVGGWNENSLTEDSDITVKLLLKGYKTVYLETETLSEVPETFEGFIKQQMRWCYGNTRVFIDYAGDILSKKTLSIKQKLMITYLTLGNFISPIIVTMTLFGSLGWFLGDLRLINLSDLQELILRFGVTSGFLLIGFLALYKKNMVKEFHYLILSSFTIGIIIAMANSVAFFRAIFNKKLKWYCTPKAENYNLSIKS